MIGVSIISIFTAKIVTIITKRVQERENFPEKPSFVDFSEHVVICGISDKTDRIIRQLHAGVMRKIDKMRQIVILGETVDLLKKTNETVYEQVWVVKGSPLDNKDLQRANISQAHAVIILSDVYTVRETVIPEMNSFTDSKNIKGVSALDKILDARTILCALAVESVLHKSDKRVHKCIELRNILNKIHFKQIKNKEIICTKEFSQKLMVQSTITFGLSRVYTGELLNATLDSTEVYRIELPKNFIGATYRQLEKCLTEDFHTEIHKHKLLKNIDVELPDVILVGFITQGYEDNEKKEVQLDTARYEAKCDVCGAKVFVPFIPDGVRPVLCKKCLKEYRQQKNQKIKK